jgi:hypothetical protein
LEERGFLWWSYYLILSLKVRICSGAGLLDVLMKNGYILYD